ncbi:MAG: DUF3990 domain-containing protein [Lentisphaeria bacterium]|nr:DUF3990 domain-containing protein [Lentisphaeria bacterium]
MILYHGSNIQVNTPRILEKLRALDFGAGFYTTSSREQAKKWAGVVTKRRQAGVPTISSYSFDETVLCGLRILKFDLPDGDWLDFVVANRKEQPVPIEYDLVIGPVADDSTLPVIDDYADGRYTKDEAIRRLLPQKLTDQYAFLSDMALSFLVFRKSEVVS